MSTPPKESFKDLLLTSAKGFCMGAADVVPGVSGGTMAFILGIYQRLIDALRAFDLIALRQLLRLQIRSVIQKLDLVFLAALGTGILAALLFFTRVVPLPALIRSHPEPVYALFFGLIAASILVLVRELGKMSPTDLIALAAGAIFGFVIISLVPTQTPETAWFVFLSGALAICAMILPGISGSFILLILQKYAYVFDAIGRFDFSVIVPFGLGAATGLIAFSRVLSWLLKQHFRPTLLTIVGILVASMWRIWPFQDRLYVTVRGKERLMESTPILPTTVDSGLWLAVALAIVGFVAVLALQHFAARRVTSH